MSFPPCACRALTLATSLVLAAPLAAAPLTPADEAAAYKAAGLMNGAGRRTTCADAEPGWPKSELAVEAVDLNADGKPEAFVSESNVACYGNTGSAFTIMSKDAAGKWRRLGGSTGIPTALKTRRMGWADIEVGGPGYGRMPVMRWTGTAYADPR